MLKGRRVGTLTTGITLIAFGILFISRLIFPLLDYSSILSLWPLVLIFLGLEILVSYIINKENTMKYDAGAITLIFILSFFAIVMAGAEFAINHLKEIRNIF